MPSIALKRSRQVPAEQTPAFAGIAERFRRAGDLERAITLCREGLTRFPNLLSARVTLGWALLDTGKYDEARTELEQVLRRAPDNLAAIRGLAELHERADGNVSAMETWQAQQDAARQAEAEAIVPPPLIVSSVAAPAVEPEPTHLPVVASAVTAVPDAPRLSADLVGAPSGQPDVHAAVELESPAASAIAAARSLGSTPDRAISPSTAAEQASGAGAGPSVPAPAAVQEPAAGIDEWIDESVIQALDRAADAAADAAAAAAPLEPVLVSAGPSVPPVAAEATVEDEGTFTFAHGAAYQAPPALVVEPAAAVESPADPAAETVESTEDLNEVIRALAQEALELESRAELELARVTALAPTAPTAEVPAFGALSEAEDSDLLAELAELVAADVEVMTKSEPPSPPPDLVAAPPEVEVRETSADAAVPRATAVVEVEPVIEAGSAVIDAPVWIPEVPASVADVPAEGVGTPVERAEAFTPTVEIQPEPPAAEPRADTMALVEVASAGLSAEIASRPSLSSTALASIGEGHVRSRRKDAQIAALESFLGKVQRRRMELLTQSVA